MKSFSYFFESVNRELLDLALHMQHPCADRYTFGLWNENMTLSLRNFLSELLFEYDSLMNGNRHTSTTTCYEFVTANLMTEEFTNLSQEYTKQIYQLHCSSTLVVRGIFNCVPIIECANFLMTR